MVASKYCIKPFTYSQSPSQLLAFDLCTDSQSDGLTLLLPRGCAVFNLQQKFLLQNPWSWYLCRCS